MTDIGKLIRPNIRKLEPYSSARDEFTGNALVYLDANENPYNQPLNRYPDPLQRELKKLISAIKRVPESMIFTGNGSDEPIDLLIRAFCEPGIDNIISIDPSYGMYQVAAGINNVQVLKVPLSPGFELDATALLTQVNNNSKLVFLCSPNNPSGNCLDSSEILKVIKGFNGIVVLDEAYIDFAPEKSMMPELIEHRNLVILQTLSKAWGMAGIRLGLAFADQEIIMVLNKIKYPYNINILTQQKALTLLQDTEMKNRWVQVILKEKSRVKDELSEIPGILKIYPSDANFLLVKTTNAREIYDFLVSRGIVVRDRSRVLHCENCLRITIGTPDENDQLIKALNDMK